MALPNIEQQAAIMRASIQRTEVIELRSTRPVMVATLQNIWLAYVTAPPVDFKLWLSKLIQIKFPKEFYCDDDFKPSPKY